MRGVEMTAVRWALTAAYLVCVVGLARTLGLEVAAWLGWVAASIGTGLPALRVWVWHLTESGEAADRERFLGPAGGVGGFSAAGVDDDDADEPPRGGTSLSVGPGRDAPHPPWRDDED